jgi:hypothetical protein
MPVPRPPHRPAPHVLRHHALIRTCRHLAIARLIPAMADQGENDDDAIEALDVEAGEPGADHAGLNEGYDQGADRAAGNRAHSAQVGVPPTNTEASTGKK